MSSTLDRRRFVGAAAMSFAASQLDVTGLVLPQTLFRKTGVRTRGQLVRVVLEHYHDQL